MGQNRIFFPVQAVGIAPNGSEVYTAVHGLQSLGVNTKFNLEDLFELGQSAVYETVENLPDVEVTLEKVLDGYPLCYHLATYGASSNTLFGRSAQRCTIAVALHSDLKDSSSGVPLANCVMSGMYYNNSSFEFTVNGPFKEQCSFVGNNKIWLGPNGINFSGGFTNTDAPLASEGVNYRQDLEMGLCYFPKDIPGISSSGTNNKASDVYGVSIQSIRASVQPSREDMLELGRKGPFFRFLPSVVPTTCDIEVISRSGDWVGATEDGIYGGGSNIQDQYIYIRTKEGTKVNLGTKMKLSSVNYGGANAGNNGGNATATYSYQGKNAWVISHPQDPTTGLAG